MKNSGKTTGGKCLRIQKSGPLCGRCAVGTSKNAVLPMLAAALLTREPVVLHHVPDISDVSDMISLLRTFGARVSQSGHTLRICARHIKTTSPNFHISSRLRASFLFMGPLLAREGCVTMPLPGGCAIGRRPIDLHLKGFEALGVKSITASGHVLAWRQTLRGAAVHLAYPSVGATENVIMAACLACGKTVIIGGACEPEVCDLIGLLTAMGAKAEVKDGRIEIEGAGQLHGAEYTPIPDRIEAGTLMIAAAVTGGDVRIDRAPHKHLMQVTSKLVEAGAEVFPYPGGIRIYGRARTPMDIVSSPYPGFPTDMQAQFMAACCVLGGQSTILETVFENRFLHVHELIKMGAHIDVRGNTAVITGVGRLCGAEVKATDLRAGAALCIAGLIADGETVIQDIRHLDRGYEHIEDKLSSLGALITREV